MFDKTGAGQKEEIHQLISHINLELIITLAKECQLYTDKQVMEAMAKARLKEVMDEASDCSVLPLPTTTDTFEFQEKIAKKEAEPKTEYNSSNSNLNFSTTTADVSFCPYIFND